MKWPAFLIWLFLTVLLGFGTNVVNLQTSEVRREVDRLSEIKELNSEKIKILEIQWTHLTNPDFIQKLTEENFERLWLVASTNLNYGSIDDLPYFPEPENESQNE